MTSVIIVVSSGMTVGTGVGGFLAGVTLLVGQQLGRQF